MAANDELAREYLESAGYCCNPTTRPVHPSCLRSTNAPIIFFFSFTNDAF